MHMRSSIYVVLSRALTGRKHPSLAPSPHKQLHNINHFMLKTT